MTISRNAFLAAALVAASLSLGGCASGARSTQMIATGATSNPMLPGQAGYRSISVSPTQGGSSTNPLWMSNVAGDQFDAALKASLQGAGLLAADGSTPAYRVSARLLELDRPFAGLALTVRSRVHYRVTESASSKTLLDEPIAASGTAKFGDSLIAVERLRLANEAAVKANIEAFIKRLQGVLRGEP